MSTGKNLVCNLQYGPGLVRGVYLFLWSTFNSLNLLLGGLILYTEGVYIKTPFDQLEYADYMGM